MTNQKIDFLGFKKEILLKEYEMLRQQMEKHDNQITQLRILLITFLGAFFGWTFKDLTCLNQLVKYNWVYLSTPLFITLFFAFNEGIIQYWKNRAVQRFKYLEDKFEEAMDNNENKPKLEWTEILKSIKGPHLRLTKKPTNECKSSSEYNYYDVGLRKSIKIR